MQTPTIRNCLLCVFLTATGFLGAYSWALTTGKISVGQPQGYTLDAVLDAQPRR